MSPRFGFNLPVVLMTVLVAVDISILLDVPFVRQILPFVYFTVIPGYLIILITKIYQKFDLVDTILFSVGLSTSLLMLIGAILSIICPVFGINEPLSSNVILLVLNILSLCLIFAIIKVKIQMNTKISSISQLEFNKLFFILTPIVFPFLAVAGTNLLDSTGDNRLVIVFILFMFIYCIILYVYSSYKRFENQDIICFLNLYLVGLSALLMCSTCSNYLMGYNDPEIEYYLFIKTLSSKCWSPEFLYSPYNACMSITTLPTIYQILTNIDSLIIFKVVLQFIIALFPVAVFSIVRKFGVSTSMAFILALMCVFQYQYILKLPTHIRTGVGLFFFALLMVVLTHKTLPELPKRFLTIIFMLSLVLSHYSTTYLALIFFIIVVIVQTILTRRQKFLTMTVYLFAVLVLWYALLVEAAYKSGVDAIKKTIINLPKLFEKEARGESALKVFGYGVETISQMIKVVTYDLFYGLVMLGILAMILKKVLKKEDFDLYDILKTSMLIVFIGFVTVPFATKVYSIERVSLQMLTILIVGVYYAIKILPIIKRYEKVWMIVLLGLLVFSGTGLNYELLGISKLSPAFLSEESAYRHFTYIYDGEIAGGKWIDKYGNHEKVVYGDFVIDSRILLSTLSRDSFIVGIIGNETKKFWQLENYRYFNERGAIEGDYLYLRFFNIKYGKMYDGQAVHYFNGTVNEEKNILININSLDLVKIYDNGFSQVYIFTKRLKPIEPFGG